MKATDYTSEAKAAAYANYRFGQGLEAVNRDELYLLQKYLASTSLSESSVLVDLGSGTGRIIDQLLKTPVKTIYAVDLSNAMLDQLEKKYVRELKEKKIKTIVASSDKTGLKLNTANGITAFHLFKHLSKIHKHIEDFKYNTEHATSSNCLVMNWPKQ